MRSILLIVVSLFVVKGAAGQIPVGAWRDHFSYNKGVAATASPERVYVASTNGAFWFNPTEGIIGKLSKVDGLTDLGISAIGYSQLHNALLVGYQNGNIDIVHKNYVVNLPYILEKPMQGSKSINHFFFRSNGEVLVSTSFGIVLLNIEKAEIKDTYYIGEGGSELVVFQTAEHNGRVYAATNLGLKSANANDPQIFHFQSWTQEIGVPGPEYEVKAVVGFNESLVIVQAADTEDSFSVYVSTGYGWQQLGATHSFFKSLSVTNNRLAVCGRQAVEVYQSIDGPVSYVHGYQGFDRFSPNFTIVDANGAIAIADDNYGLMYNTNGAWAEIRPDGPDNNNVFHVSPFNDDILVARGARTDSWGNRWYPFSIHRFSGNEWTTKSYPDYFDAVRILPNKLNSSEFFMASWGNGVALFRDGELLEMYGPENSSLQSIISGPYCRISGLAQDADGNLWVANGAVANPISVRMVDGTWVGFPYQNEISSDRLSDAMFSPSGDLWVIIPAGGGIFVLNPGENLESASDDDHKKIKLTDYEGNLLPNEIHSMAFDREGYLWVGTNEGVLISYNPERVFDSGFYAQRIKIPDVIEEFAVFLLEQEVITSIAVDGGNRKWFGTARSGVYLQSADGTKQIAHFDTDNSPLPSNNIQHLALHPKTGELFIATDKGLVSYRTDSTEPERVFGKVYAFPNPVRPEYQGDITITGLVEETIVKITDVAGNLVYEARSQGGQATWNGKNFAGQRVSTGVYLFFCSDSKGEQSAVGKILFVK
ncbi:MAG TPA: two-component regulator propeller domain-containing protein [Tenuifilaceae bacterium]|nr:two-component regulator propeller domain-containing protein [Tenuifilaceae bacterium]